MPLSDLFVHVYVLVNDAGRDQSLPAPTQRRRRSILARPGKAAFLEEVRRTRAGGRRPLRVRRLSCAGTS